MRQNCRNCVFVDKLTKCRKSCTNNRIAIRFEILLDGVDNEDDEIMILISNNLTEVPSFSTQNIVVMGHFYVRKADDVLKVYPG